VTSLQHLADHRRWLTERLQELQPSHRAAFAASCAERLYGTYVFIARQPLDARPAEMNPTLLRKALMEVWSFLASGEVRAEELEDLSQSVESIAPDLNEEGADLAQLALESVASVCYAVNACLSGQVEDAVYAGESAVNSVDFYLQSLLVDVEPDREEQVIRSHRLMVRELKKQDSDLTYLKDIPILSAEACEFLRATWEHSPKSNIDLL
jgi:uncharacterized protein YjaG (DUF416 family)